MPFAKIVDPPLSERLAEQIRQAIFTGQLKVGSKIPQDTLAHAFGVSRMPIREALALLSHEGLVVLAPRRGAWVAPLSLQTVDESYAMRRWAESEAVRLSVPHLDSAALAQAEDALQVLEWAESAENPAEFVAANRRFHLVLRSRCPWPKLASWVDTLWKGFPPLTPQFVQNQMVRDHEEHRQLLNASRRHEGDEAAHLMAQHIGRSWQSARTHFAALGWPEISDVDQEDQNHANR